MKLDGYLRYIFNKKILLCGLAIFGILGGFLISQFLPQKWNAEVVLSANRDLKSEVVTSELRELLYLLGGSAFIEDFDKKNNSDRYVANLSFELESASNFQEFLDASPKVSEKDRSSLMREFGLKDGISFTVFSLKSSSEPLLRIEALSTYQHISDVLEEYLRYCERKVLMSMAHNASTNSIPLIANVKMLVSALQQAIDLTAENQSTMAISPELFMVLAAGETRLDLPEQYLLASMIEQGSLKQLLAVEAQRAIDVSQALTHLFAGFKGARLVVNHSPFNFSAQPVFPNIFLNCFLGLLLMLGLGISKTTYDYLRAESSDRNS